MTVYRQKVLIGAVGTIKFDFNGSRQVIGPNDILHLQAKEGINTFTVIGTHLLFEDQKLAPTWTSTDSSFFFNYIPGEIVRIGVAAREPSIIEKLEKDGKLIERSIIEKGKSTHTIYASPHNAKISVIDELTKIEKIVYDNSRSNTRENGIAFPIDFNTQKEFYHPFLIKVTWDQFDYTHTYKVNILAGLNSQAAAIPSETSRKYSLYRASSLSGREKIQFMCDRGLYEEYSSPKDCLQAEIAKIERAERDEIELKAKQELELKLATPGGQACQSKLRGEIINPQFIKCIEIFTIEQQAKLELKSKLATPEGQACKSKLRGEVINPPFLECMATEKKNLEEKQKYAEALGSKEGKQCSVIQKNSLIPFWSCYEEQLKITQEISRDDMAKECVSIGFEYGTSPYRECYLKLKIHSEQIAEWRRLESAIKSQPRASTTVVPSTTSSEDRSGDTARLLEIANDSINSAFGSNRPRTALTPPPPPTRIITPRGNSYTCSMMGAAMRCR